MINTPHTILPIKNLFLGFLLTIFIPYTLWGQQIDCDNGTNTAGPYQCSNVNFKSRVDLSTLGASEANDIWGWTSPNTNREYAIIGLVNGYAFVDITDPINPIKIGNLPTHSGNSSWGDIKVSNNYVYCVSEASGHHIQVFDLFQLESVANPPIIFNDNSYSVVNIGSGNAHNIVIDEEAEVAYSVGTRSLCSGGLVAHDISDPANPIYSGCFSTDGYTHDAICFIYRGEDTEHIGKEICIGFNENTYTIVDMTDKSNPIQLSRNGYSGFDYTHQGWITDDQKFLLLDDELDEQGSGVNTTTYIFDISDLDAPSPFYNYVSSIAAIDHNLYVRGSYAYQANYRGGLRILDLSNIGTLNGITEAAYFDFYPSNNSAQFNSAWSSYPYFKSGNIIVSDIEQGLFVVEPQLPHFIMDFAKREGIKEACTETSVSYEIDLTAYAGFSELVTLTASNLPSGVTANFSNNNTDPDGSTILTLNGVDGLTTDNYHILLEGAATGSPDQKLALGLIKKAAVTKPSLQVPSNGATDVPGTVNLEWTLLQGSATYEVQVATDAGFANIIATQNNVNGLSYTANGLDPNTTYYWRVRAEPAICTDTDWADTYSFVTSNVVEVCDPTSISPGIGINENGTPTITSTINITESGTISDVNILDLNISHSYIGDLEASLTAPDGTEVSLFDRPGFPNSQYGCEEDNLLLSFDDGASNISSLLESSCSTSSTIGTYAIQGAYRSINPMSVFNGKEMQGTWTLSITDNFNGDGGALNSWTLDLCSFQQAALPISLVDFKATAQKEAILLSWEVASQVNNKGFDVMRSTEPNRGFSAIGWIEADIDTKIYQLEDTDVTANTVYYYQLMQKDENGKSTNSAIVQAHISTGIPSFSLVPNPAKDKVAVQLSAPLATDSAMKISLMTLDGKVLYQGTYTGAQQSYELSLADLPTGVYLVRMESDRGVEVKRLVTL